MEAELGKPVAGMRAHLSNKVVVAAVAGFLALSAGSIFVALYQPTWPSNGPISQFPSYGDTLRDQGFAELDTLIGKNPGARPVLKIYLGWGQYVWMEFRPAKDGVLHVGMIEGDSLLRKVVHRSFEMDAAEAGTFLQQFDKAALGLRFVDRRGYDGREISFERQREGSVVSYEGNASFSARDARMARVIDRLVLRHGGYTFVHLKDWDEAAPR